MPETPLRQRNRGRQLPRYNFNAVGKSTAIANKTTDGPDARTRNQRRAFSPVLYADDEEVYHPVEFIDDDYGEDVEEDPMEKLCQSLKPHLTECSSQRLRCLHMMLRRLSNADNRISEKDMLLAFQENHVALTSRLIQVITEMFGGQQGIDYEMLYKCLVNAHNMTGRDSVKARRKRNDLDLRPQLSQEKQDADFLSRIEKQLIRDQTFFDIDMLKTEFQALDEDQSGKIQTDDVRDICSEKTPLYGALLDNLLKRCDEDKNGTTSWPILLSFMERGQVAAREKDPDLHLLPEKARATAAVNIAHDPYSVLSEAAKTLLVNKLKRRSSTRSGVSGRASVLSNEGLDERPDSPLDKTLAPDKDGKDGHIRQERPVSFEDDNGDDHKAKQKKEAEMSQSSGPSTAFGVLMGMKKLLSGGRLRIQARKAGEEATKVPVIEVDKASEADLNTSLETDNQEEILLNEAPDTNRTDQSVSDVHQTTNSSAVAHSDAVNISIVSKDSTSHTSGPSTVTTSVSFKHLPATTSADVTAPTTTTSISQSTRINTTDITNDTGESEKRGWEDTETPSSHNVKEMEESGMEMTVPKDYSQDEVTSGPPDEHLQLEWVYGCRGNDCRRNVHILRSGEVIYFISNVCIILDREANVQRHYREHTQDIKCLVVQKDSDLVASGQFASKLRAEHMAHVRVWRADLLQTLHVLGAGIFTKAVMCLAFMPSAAFLVAVDNAQDKCLTVWDLNTGSNIADNYFSTDTVCDMDFNPKYPQLLVTCGKEHLQWWKLYPEECKLLPYSGPDYESYPQAKYVVCAFHTDRGDLVTGDSNGTIYIWGDGGNSITNFIKHGHDGPVLSVLYHQNYLLTGGRDGNICAWSWARTMEHKASVQIPGSEGGVRTLQVRKGSLLICTTMNSMLSITLANSLCPLENVTLDPVPITQGHFDDLLAMTVIRDSFIQADILTAGSDGVLCKFNSSMHSPVWKLFVKGMQYTCVDCSDKGDVIVLGTIDGRVVHLEVDHTTLQVMEILNEMVTTSKINCISLSPDNRWTAAGGEDSCIYIFHATEQEDGVLAWLRVGVLKGHSGQVSAVDWTLQPYVDELFLLRSSSTTPEQKFWDVFRFGEVDGSELTIVTWATSTCTLDYQLTGVWRSKQAKRSQVNALDVNPAQTLVAMGNSHGILSLYRYPCDKDVAYSNTCQAHQNVRVVRFTPSGQRVLTAGGQDSALMQWLLV